jgi:beta-glucosidase
VLGTTDEVDEAAHHALARRAATESIVLLKHEGDLLPFGGGPVAVIGELARRPRFQGAGSSRVNPTRVDIPLDELTDALGADRVAFAAGYGLRRPDDDEALLAEAVEVAGAAGTVVCFLGLPAAHESEGFDRADLELPAAQVRLLDAVLAANPAVVVVLVNGSVVRVSSWVDRVPALVECWLGGQAAGGAVADVLTGRAEPGGRLAETVPVRLEDTPSFLTFPGEEGHVRYGEGIFIGYRGHDRLAQPVSFPFGHGLSYTTFDLSDLEVDVSGAVATDDLRVGVTVTVANTGVRAGSHVVQAYVSDPVCSLATPVRELQGFAKVRLEPGARQRATITLGQRAFSHWSTRLARWVVEAGAFTIAVGSSSRDLPLACTIDLDAPSTAPPLDDWSTLHEWRADATGRRLLDEVAGDDPWLADEPAVALFGSMPLRTLAANSAFRLDHERLAEVVERWRAEADR